MISMPKSNAFSMICVAYKQRRKESNGCFPLMESKALLNIDCFSQFFFAGDTMEHNKLCSLRGGSMSTFPCRMCSTTSKNLDNPANVPNDKLTIGSKIKEL